MAAHKDQADQFGAAGHVRGVRRGFGYLVWGLAVSGLIAGHLHVRARGFDYSGPAQVLDHLYVIMVVALLLLICSAVGSGILQRWSFGLDQPLERLSFSIAVGAGLIATGILVCGLLGWLVLTLPLLLGCIVLARHQLIAVPSLVRGCARQVTTAAHPAALTVFAVVLMAMLVLALAPPADYDSLMYHVQVPVRFLSEGRIYLVPGNPHVAQTAVPHMLYLPLIMLAGLSAPAVFSTLVTALLGVGIFSYCSRFLGRSVASTALAVLWGSPILLLVGATAKIDVTFAWLLFLATYALAVAASERRTQTVLLGGFLIGMATGTKLLALPFVLALLPIVGWASLRCVGGRPGPAARLAFGLGAVAVGVSLPWIAKNWLLMRAPLAPAFTQQRMDPWLSDLYSGKALPPGMTNSPPNALTDVRSKFNLRDFILDPGRLTPEVEGKYYLLNPIALLSAAVFVLPNWRGLLLLLIPGLAYPFILLTPYPYTNLRYLIPSIALLTVVGTTVAVQLLNTLPRRARVVGFCVIYSVCLAPTVHAVADQSRLTEAFAVAAGSTSPRGFLLFSGDQETRGYYWMTELVNRLVPVNARVLLLFEGRGLYFAPFVLQDNVLRTWVFLRPLVESGDCLEGSGITHVLVHNDVLDYYARRGLDLGKLGWNGFDAFARRCLVPLEPQPAGYALYRLR